jgi:MFS family permease
MSFPPAGRPATSNFRWVICTLLFFSTTVNYMDRQVISYLKDYFGRPAHQAGDSQMFSAGDFIDLSALAAQLNQPANAVSFYVKTNLSQPTVAALANYRDSGPEAEALRTNLVQHLAQDLNTIISGPPIYDAARFAGVVLPPETQKLLALNPPGDSLPRLNRLLLDDAYPREISRDGFGWSNTDFAHLTAFFTGFYAGMTILAGWVIDKIGTKMGLALSLIIWSIFGILNAFVGRLVAMHVLVRSAFGIGEAGNFPASIKTVAEWFPKRERALATGIFNSGSNCGAMVAALFVPWCLTFFGYEKGWKLAFIITGAVGFIWLIFWFWLYDTPAKNKWLSQAEYDYIHSDRDETGPEDKSAKKISASLFSFHGRAPRAAFWGVTIMIHILCVFIYFITEKIVGPKVLQNQPSLIFFGLTAVVAVAASLALHVRRWHDLNQSGWLALTYLIPVAAAFVSVVVLGFDNMICLVPVGLAVVAMIAAGFKRGGDSAGSFGSPGSPGLLGYRQTWAFFVGKLMTDGVWWFYLFWLPDYLVKQFHMKIHDTMWPTFIVFGASIVGSVYGGSIPMTLMKRGLPVYRARMTAMLLIAVCPLIVLTTEYFGDPGRFGHMALIYAIAIIGIGAAAHQAWSANLFTTVSDMFPKKAVGSVTGIGAMAGGLGGVIVQLVAGTLTDLYKQTPQTAYLIMFVICALSYLIAWAGMKMLVPRHQPITDL